MLTAKPWCSWPRNCLTAEPDVLFAPTAIFGRISENSSNTVMKRFKSRTAQQANRLLGRVGRFWQACYHDHAIRSDESLYRHALYLMGNGEVVGRLSAVGTAGSLTGVFVTGFVFVALNWRLTVPELSYQLADSGASAVLYDAELDRLRRLWAGQPIVSVIALSVAISLWRPRMVRLACAR